MNPLLSIIVPVYNVCGFVEMCINSILNQTLTDFELIIVDDGSTDGSGELCDAVKERDERVFVIHKNKNCGVVSARKTGVCAARGKYIGYVDADDWIEPDMYEKMLSYMTEYDCDIVMCEFLNEHKPLFLSSGGTRINIDGGYYDEQKIKDEILPIMIYSGEFYRFGIYPVIWNKLYKREKLIKYQMAVDENIQTGEDAACVYPYLLNSASFYFIKDYPLYHYRHSEGQMTVTFDCLNFERLKSLYKFFSSSEIATSPYSGQLCYYYAYIIKSAVSNELRRGNNIPFGEKLKNIRRIFEFASNEGFMDKLRINALHHRLYFKLVKDNKPLLIALGIYITRFLQKLFRGNK